MMANGRDARFGLCFVCPILGLSSARELEHALSLNQLFLNPMLLRPPPLRSLLPSLVPLSLLPLKFSLSSLSLLTKLLRSRVASPVRLELFAALAVEPLVAMPLAVSTLDVAPMVRVDLTVRGRPCFQGSRMGSLNLDLMHSLLSAL